MCHGVGQDGCMMNLTKASNVPYLCFMVCVCVWGGWVPFS